MGICDGLGRKKEGIVEKWKSVIVTISFMELYDVRE
jgi:hypothetical protein